MKRTFILAHDQARQNALAFVAAAPAGFCVTVSEPTRSLEQNAALWAKLGEIAAQVVWHGRNLSPESWKTIFTASLKKQDVVPGIDGGFVVMGTSTSRMTKAELSDLLELITAFGAQHDVQFDEVAA
jgi:hypothetical protein